MKKYHSEIPSFNIGDTYDPSCITVVSANVRCYTQGDKGKLIIPKDNTIVKITFTYMTNEIETEMI